MIRHLLLTSAALALATASAARAQSASDPQESASKVDSSEIVVVGSRGTPRLRTDTPAPVDVLSGDTLTDQGADNLSRALSALSPSFNFVPAVTSPSAEGTRPVTLRGLTPDQVLVLVNGHRRHAAAVINTNNGIGRGTVPVDLNTIPVSAIERIEVLRDGAAAQYGSDAIAGVINVILDDRKQGGSFSATAGQYFKGDGLQYAATLDLATSLGGHGFLDLSGLYRKHAFSANGGLDSRVSNPDGTLLASLSPAQRAAYVNLPNYPYVSKNAFGDPRSTLAVISYNAGYDIGAAELYSFGTYGHRNAASLQVVRFPDTTIASPVLGVKGTFTTPGELIFAPNGYTPQQAIRQNDLSSTVGIKGSSGYWKWDLSSTYGQDKVRIYNNDSANNALFVDTPFTPSRFYIGLNKSTEWTSNLDISKEISLGLFAPLNLAFGAEYRRNSYQVEAGDPASYYKEGAQSLPGLTPFDAGKYSRNNVAGYLDLALQPVEKLRLDAAARYERYSDFGGNLSAKLTGRYDISDAFALRGTVSTGFRAPTLAEEHYSTTSASPTRVAVLLPANSAPAKLVGFQNLKPEKATNFSVGTVVRPIPRLTVTIDAYQISIRDRILATGNIFGRGGKINSQAVLDAITSRGVSVDPSVGSVSITTLTNGMNTRTRGVDITANYRMMTASAGTFNWIALANFNDKKITHIDATPAPIAGQSMFDRRAQGLVTTSTPSSKIIGGVDWSLGKVSATLRETHFGPAYVYNPPNNGNYVRNEVSASFITDLELGLAVNGNVSVAVGANNLFNKKPEGVKIDPVTGQISVGGQTVWNFPLTNSPYGINGGYYYGRITLKW